MKRFTFVGIVALLSVLVFALLRAKESSLEREAGRLQTAQTEIANEISKEEAQQALLQRTIAGQKSQSVARAQEPRFSSALTAWLLAGNFSSVADSLVPELRSALAFPPNLSPDFVLISKPSLRVLTPPSPGRNDKLSDALCGLLSLSSRQRQDIETALSDSRHQFSVWAAQNLQRQGPQGETLVRYTIPASDGSDGITNRLMSQLDSIMGAERLELFSRFADSWFQIQNGYLGGVTNTLSVLRQLASDGSPTLLYKLTREGPNSAMSEGPGPIQSQFFPPAWRNLFPGGWQEVAQREGFELPSDSGQN